MHENPWGWLIVLYLFLAGAGAGAFIAAAAAQLLAPDWSKALARAGSIASGPLVILGTLFLVLDLEAGLWQPWRQIYMLSNPQSMITWGVVMLALFIPITLLYAAGLHEFTFVGRFAKRHLNFLGGVGSFLAAGVAGYTGVLIAVVNGVPFWNTPVMPTLFMASAMSTGLAVAMVGAAIIDIDTIRTLSNLALGHIIFLITEGVVLMLFVFMSLTRSTEAAASAMTLISGGLAPYFWGIVVILGILIPLTLSVVEYWEHGEMPKYLVVGADLLILFGGFSLRALIIFSGGPPNIV